MIEKARSPANFFGTALIGIRITGPFISIKNSPPWMLPEHLVETAAPALPPAV
jgi:hypothetical protein